MSAEESVGGFDVKFNDDSVKLSKIECSICNLVFRKPVQLTPCGHRFCESCFQKHSQVLR